jgi:hypothetical protein
MDFLNLYHVNDKRQQDSDQFFQVNLHDFPVNTSQIQEVIEPQPHTCASTKVIRTVFSDTVLKAVNSCGFSTRREAVLTEGKSLSMAYNFLFFAKKS